MFRNSNDARKNAAGTYTDFYRCLEESKSICVQVDNCRLTSFASFGVLGLQHSVAYKNALLDAYSAFGAHPGSARVFFEDRYTRELEAAIADSFASESALIFPSTTIAHMALLPALKRDGYSFVVTRQVHMSVRNALRYARAQRNGVLYVESGSIEALKENIARLGRSSKWLFVCDSLYGMDGSLEPLEQVKELVVGNGGRFYIDDSHATGLYGHSGLGLGVSLKRQFQDSIVVGSFAKAMGSYGAFSVLSAEMRDRIVTKDTISMFTGPLPSPCIAQSKCGWDIVRSPQGADIRKALQERVKRFALLCGIRDHTTHIFYFQCDRPLETFRSLFGTGYLVNPVLFPGVPRSGEGIRVVISSDHSMAQLEGLAAAISSQR